MTETLFIKRYKDFSNITIKLRKFNVFTGYTNKAHELMKLVCELRHYLITQSDYEKKKFVSEICGRENSLYYYVTHSDGTKVVSIDIDNGKLNVVIENENLFKALMPETVFQHFYLNAAFADADKVMSFYSDKNFSYVEEMFAFNQPQVQIETLDKLVDKVNACKFNFSFTTNSPYILNYLNVLLTNKDVHKIDPKDISAFLVTDENQVSDLILEDEHGNVAVDTEHLSITMDCITNTYLENLSQLIETKI